MQLLGGAATTRTSRERARPVLARDPLEERVSALEAEVAALRAALSELGL